jgi:hypothetical protein
MQPAHEARSIEENTRPPGNNAATSREKAVTFAECMRANGVSAFRDPDASAELTIDVVASGSTGAVVGGRAAPAPVSH